MTHNKDNEDVIWIADLRTSTLLLFRDQRFRGYCLLSFAPRHVTSLESLSEAEYQLFFLDLRAASWAIREALKPDHMNYELLGNSDPRLHWHIVPRYKSDPRWGQPIWEDWPRGEFNINRYVLSDAEYGLIVDNIREYLALIWIETDRLAQ